MVTQLGRVPAMVGYSPSSYSLSTLSCLPGTLYHVVCVSASLSGYVPGLTHEGSREEITTQSSSA